MAHFHPAPGSTVADLVKWRWSKANPAPEAAVYLWIRHITWEDGTVSIRDVANYAGWGTTKAARVRQEALDWYEAWDGSDSKRDSHATPTRQSRDSHATPKRKNTREIQGATRQQRDSSATAPRQSRDVHARVLLPTDTEQKRKQNTSTAKAVRRVFDHWLTLHPRASQELTNPDRTKIAGRLKQKDVTEQDMLDVIDWIHTAPDARHWQGENSTGKKHLGITPLFKPDKFNDRLESARTWADAGRATESTNPTTNRRNGSARYDDPDQTGALDRMYQRLKDEEDQDSGMYEIDEAPRDQERPKPER